jgi:hypothetical protein
MYLYILKYEARNHEPKKPTRYTSYIVHFAILSQSTAINFVLLRHICRRIHTQLRRHNVILYITNILVFETYT